MSTAGFWLAVALVAQDAAPPLYEFRPVDTIRGELLSIPFDSPRTINRPSLSARHALLVGEAAIPADGIDFTVRCRVDARSGRVTNCETPTAPAAWHRAALGLASLYSFDVTGLFAEGRPPFVGVVTIHDRIVPADVQPAARRFHLDAATAAAGSKIVFTDASDRLATDYYPQMAIRLNEQARVQVDCQVQPDLSLFCVDAEPVTGSPPLQFAGLFRLAMYQIMGLRHVAPALRDGTPAVGAIFRYILTFRLPQE